VLRLFGDNIVTTESGVWRAHRRIAAPTFNERNSALFFAEAVSQTSSMLDAWRARGDGATIVTADHDTMCVALHIIGYVGFGLRLLWPGEHVSPDTHPRWAKYGSLEPMASHSMYFSESVAAVISNLLPLLITPTWLLRELALVAHDLSF
jgi:hypothetical protein